jgi:hypothetical protein
MVQKANSNAFKKSWNLGVHFYTSLSLAAITIFNYCCYQKVKYWNVLGALPDLNVP